jgi:hypothetical protein
MRLCHETRIIDGNFEIVFNPPVRLFIYKLDKIHTYWIDLTNKIIVDVSGMMRRLVTIIL